MTITYTGLFAIAWGITSAILLFAFSSIWACFEYLKHKEEEESIDDKFEYHIEYGLPVSFKKLGAEGWELIQICNGSFIFIRPLKDKKS